MQFLSVRYMTCCVFHIFVRSLPVRPRGGVLTHRDARSPHLQPSQLPCPRRMRPARAP